MNMNVLCIVVVTMFSMAYGGIAANYGFGFNTYGKEGAASVHAQGSMHDYGFNLQQQHKGGSSYIKQNAAFTHETPVAVEPHSHHVPHKVHAPVHQYHHAPVEHHYSSGGNGGSASGFGGGF